ncbi:uncharacterized protein LOC129723610 [Wyeomyia smithii]|uniref:uncharacterized protein LOC129723610 n=1 Tax=Wyeomyia smithii TaxID=174621 RepID=UPI002467E155|nr:uncharacterized protein LOC129723610 [Wyeomyia smithii]
MNFLIVTYATILVAIYASARTEAQEDVPGIKVPASALARSTIPGTCAANGDVVCTTCNTLSICINGNPTAEVTCGGDFPYCNPGSVQASCSATPAAGCGGSDNGGAAPIVCSSIGVFPDPLICTSYHVCREGQTTSDLYVCPSGTRFNLATSQCRAQTNTNCVTIRCNTTNSGFAYYGTSRQYYAFCSVTNGVATPYILKCPNRATFSMNTLSCVYSCPGQGNFVNTNDPTTYYQCYILNGRWVADLRRCPTGTSFNQTLTYCV